MKKILLKIDFVSDVVCPWCIIGYKRLEKAMEMFEDEVTFDLNWHPLNRQKGSKCEISHLEPLATYSFGKIGICF